MKSSFRQSVENGLVSSFPALGDAVMRASRPDPWRSHYDETRTLFIHIPRTAGGSISDALYDGRDTGHIPARVYRAFDPDKFRDYFSFAFVRNPFDRFVSAYHRMLQNPSSNVTRNWADKYVRPLRDFDAFANAMASSSFAWKIMGHPHFAQQTQMVCINGEIAVSHIARFETLAEDFNAIVAEHFPKAQPHADYATYFTPKTRDIVARLYKDDIALFDYSFD
jgi:chondroitin 4-sulfotransferase 11